MGAGKLLSILGGLITILGMFAFNWFVPSLSAIESSLGVPAGGLTSIGVGAASYVYAIGGIKKMAWFLSPEFATLLSNVSTYAGVDIPSWVAYIILVVVILFVAGGILQMIGAKVRALAITGAILPLLFSLILILKAFGITFLPENIAGLIDFFTYVSFGDTTAIVAGVLPYEMYIQGLGLGMFLIFVGSLLALISGFMSRDDF